MSWIFLAIISAVILASVNIVDSHILSRRLNRFRVYLCILGPVYLVIGALLYVLFPLPANLTPWLVLGAIGNSMLRAAGIAIMMYLLRTQAVSRVIPVVYTYPVLVAILAVPILGESLSSLTWLAVLVVVGGVLLVGLGRGPQGKFTRGNVILIATACVLFAGADISSKYLLDYYSFWKLLSINTLVMGAMFGAAGFRPDNFRQARALDHRDSLLALMIINEAVAIGAMLLGTQAMSLGPISIVSAILGSRPIFVALLAMAVSYIMPSFIGAEQARERKAITLAAAGMIVAGIVLIYVG